MFPKKINQVIDFFWGLYSSNKTIIFFLYFSILSISLFRFEQLKLALSGVILDPSGEEIKDVLF